MSTPIPIYRLPAPQRAILGAGGVFARAMAALDTHTPTIVVGGERLTHIHRFDVVILGNNTLLAALTARAAAVRGKSVLLAGAFGMEGMPVGLVDDAAFRLSVLRAAGSEQAIEDALTFSNSVTWCRQRVDFALWETADLAVLTPHRAGGTVAMADPLAAELRRRAEICCPKLGFPFRGKRRHGVLTTKVVVTSAISGLADRREECDPRGHGVHWSHGSVIGFGTARRDDRTVGDAVSAIMEDIALIASGDWLPL